MGLYPPIVGAWLSLVERLVWDQDVAGSNPVAPTIYFNGLHKLEPSKPVAHPVARNGPGDQVWRALAEIGRQLPILASAQLGEAVITSQPIPTPTHAQRVAGPDPVTVIELVNQFLLVKARTQKSDRYLRALRNSLTKFVQGRAQKDIREVTCEEIEDWMASFNWTATTQKGYVGDLRTLFNFAVKRGLLRDSPARGVELPDEELGEIQIHTPDQAARVLAFARSYNPHICRALAIRYFAGLRSVEVERLEEIRIGDKYIEVTAATAKGGRARRRRLVTIQPNLRAWLDLGGEVPVKGNKSNVWRDFNSAMVRATGIEWHHNVTRHSFCSYHLMKFEQPGKTAMESGHTEAMLFRHYRELVTQDAATAFFNIKPG